MRLLAQRSASPGLRYTTAVTAGRFVYDFLIYEGFQRQGYGGQALLTLEAKVRELGIARITLHGFAHNHVARALCENAGRETAGIYLTKKLTR